jgi:hypothetical protein
MFLSLTQVIALWLWTGLSESALIQRPLPVFVLAPVAWRWKVQLCKKRKLIRNKMGQSNTICQAQKKTAQRPSTPSGF